MITNNYNYGIDPANTVQAAIQPWVEWKHLSVGKTHCLTCLKLDKCLFAKNNMPHLPQHDYCHCMALPKSALAVQRQATAESAYSKFDPYLFNTNGAYSHGKEALFQSWGYTASDSHWLKMEIERQGLVRYTEGKYILNKLDHNGQRINIVVTIPRKDGRGEVSFTTGWVVYPNGRIKLATPYGDA